MALTRGIFIRKDGKAVADAAGTDPRSARKAMSGLIAINADGVPRSGIFPQKEVLIVVGSQAGMTYRVKPFEGAMIRDAGGSDGVVLYANDAITDVSTSPAPSTGSRWDLVYVQYPESTTDSTSSKPVLGVVQGTASGTPSKPSALLPASSYVLAESLVSAGNSTTLDASISQVWRFTAARGTAISVRNQLERDEIAAFPGLRVTRLDNGTTEKFTGAKWIREDSTKIVYGAAVPAGEQPLVYVGAGQTARGAGGTPGASPATDGSGRGYISFSDLPNFPAFNAIRQIIFTCNHGDDIFKWVAAIYRIDATGFAYQARRLDNASWANGYGSLAYNLQVWGY